MIILDFKLPKKKEPKATKAIYIRTRMIDEVEKICRREGLSFSEVVDSMIETCLQNLAHNENEGHP